MSSSETSVPGTRSPQGFRHLGEEERFEGWRIKVVQARFESPDGTTFTRDIVRHPGAVAVVPVTEQHSALLVRQYRGPVDREVLEIPAGTRDVDGEPAEQTAVRELAEEVGVRARRIRLMGTVLNSPGFCDEETQVYLATDLEPTELQRHGEEETHMESVEVPLGEVGSMIASGELTDAQTIVGLLLAREVIAADR